MKLTTFKEDVENISRLPDRPNLEAGFTSEELKAYFDKAGRDIKSYINGVLIEELASSAEHGSGADKIGSGAIETLPGNTVQEKLAALSSQIRELASGTIPDGSITPDKFSPAISAFLTSASVRRKAFLEKGEYTFKVERSGTYKITMVGGGGGGGQLPSNILYSCAGGGGASAILWCDLVEGDVCLFKVGGGGRGLKMENEAIVHATAGESTTFHLNSVLKATAEGGYVGLEARAKATGGDLNISGGYPVVGSFFNSSSAPAVINSIGGESLLGRGSAFEGDEAGIGGGGFASKRLTSTYYRSGAHGGDGGVIIEYIS